MLKFIKASKIVRWRNLSGDLDGLMGNASEVNIQDVRKEFAKVLTKDETVDKAYKLIRDLFIFTNKRLLLVDKQGLTGRKVELHSIPYKSITHFSIETAGNFDLDAELKIWISGSAAPIQKQFNKSLNIYELQSVLAEYVL
ncbi:PH domain-containing protein [Anaerobacillus sp. CMMVII]|nr:PH domain-containing protein [Anaerobacillus sp. CMMVII]